MGTVIRSKISKNNPYYINKHRYYELKHYCLQYYIWKEAADSLLELKEKPNEMLDQLIPKKKGKTLSPVERISEAREGFLKYVERIEKAAKLTDPLVGGYILECVTKNLSYDKLNARKRIPCNKTDFYILYRKFFWILSSLRD